MQVTTMKQTRMMQSQVVGENGAKRGNKEQIDSKNKEKIPKKKSKRKDEKEKLLLAVEEKEALIGEKDLCINMLSKEKERILEQMRDSEIIYSERISILETALHEKDQTLTQQAVNEDLINNGLEKKSPPLRQLQKEIEQEREADLHMLKVMRSNLEQVMANEQQARLRLEDELRQARETGVELERRLENERLLRETSRRDVQTKEDTIREQSQLLWQERELKSGLEERVRDMQILVKEERSRRIATERELSEERITLQQDRENLEREREIYQQRTRDSERTVSESEHRRRELQETLGVEQQARLRLEEELRQAREIRAELERRLENERLLRETSRQDVQTKEDTIREQSQLLQQERELKSGLEERVRDLQIQIEVERNRRIATEREVMSEERINLQQDRENLEREREIYQQRIRDSERTASESQHRLRELQSAVATAQEALAEYRRLEPRDWIIRRDEVILSERSLGVGAWGNVYEGTFRGCQVAVKQIHDLILSPHNRRLFEREMSIASRCRHPHLLQFIGATNDDGSPLFITELLDTDLRNVLTQRALHHEEVVCIALDVAKGLNYLHLNKPFPIIHRDISSSNVLLWRRDDCWRAKLSDYGAANFMRQYMTSNPGARIYAAPELQTSQQSPKVDVYSYGLLLCEMCIRELPVPQQIQDQIGLVTNGVLRELIMRCVARAPEARPTMNDVIFVLTQQAESLRAEGLVTLNGRTATL
ncbi:uncharacterized protein [Porites lutea]|uniref:uncharacterized protein n=1 Tax=Porites lutea TaxID=51062 RepID=UPI003CC60B6B